MAKLEAQPGVAAQVWLAVNWSAAFGTCRRCPPFCLCSTSFGHCQPMTLQRDRIGGAAAALLLQALLLAALYFGLLVPAGLRREAAAMLMIEPVAVPPAPVIPAKRLAPRPRARAAPPAPRSKATPIVIPPPIIPVFEIPPIIAADTPGIGARADQGAATAGEGSGSGGTGDGTGSGDAGDGDGGGGTPAQWIKGRIRDSDYPREAIMGNVQGALVARYRIGTNGRVEECRVIQSSGNALLDSTTCRLVQERFRFRPARDAAGRKTTDTLFEEHAWVIGPPIR